MFKFVNSKDTAKRVATVYKERKLDVAGRKGGIFRKNLLNEVLMRGKHFFVEEDQFYQSINKMSSFWTVSR
jgi:hypothetical protein